MNFGSTICQLRVRKCFEFIFLNFIDYLESYSLEFLADVHIVGDPFLQFCLKVAHGNAGPYTCRDHVVVDESPMCKAVHCQRGSRVEEVPDVAISCLPCLVGESGGKLLVHMSRKT